MAYEDRFKNPDNDPRGAWLLTDVTAPYERPKLRFEWGGQFPPKGRCWRFSQEKARNLESDDRIVFAKNGMPRLKRYLDELKEVDEVSSESKCESKIELIVREAMKKIASQIALNPSCLSEIEWRDLERVLREVFEALGFDTELTRSGRDGGFDLKLIFDQGETKVLYLVEVKHWVSGNKKPGEKVTSALFDIVVSTSESTKGLLLSSSGFTKGVMFGRAEIEQRLVHLGEKRKIVSLCNKYLKKLDGVWYPAHDLEDILLEDTY